MKMKRSYFFLVGIILVGFLFIKPYINGTLMKASEDMYVLDMQASKDGQEVPVTITIAKPKNETLYLRYEGLSNLQIDELSAGVSKEYKDRISIEDSSETEKIIQVVAGETALTLQFPVRKLLDADKGKLSLVNASGVVLVSKNVDFSKVAKAKKEASFSPNLEVTDALHKSKSKGAYLVGNYPGDRGEPGPTTEEMALANAIASAQLGFNPDRNVAYVATWADFRTKYNDASVTKIVLAQDIANTGNQSVSNRTTSIEIDGQGHKLHLGTQNLEVRSPTDGIGFFHIHDLVAQQTNNNGLTASGKYAFVYGSSTVASYTSGWTFRTGNITTNPVDGERVGRFIRAYQAMIQVYGYMNLTTTEENFYTGGVKVEDKTQWYGTTTYANYSVVWFVASSTLSDSTSKSMEFTIGKNAIVSLKNETGGASFPAIYEHYQKITVGEGSTYNSNMTGNSVRFNAAGSSLTIKKDASVNLLSRGNGEVVQFAATNTSVNVEEGGSIFVVGNTTGGLVNLAGAGVNTNRSFIMNKPKAYDIRNRNDAGTIFNTAAVATQKIQITSSDIDLWNKGVNMFGPSQETYALVSSLTYLGSGGASSTEPSLNSFKPANYRRMSGMNSKPEIIWEQSTNANKSLKVRVLIGLTPTDNFDANGNVVMQEVYASAGQAMLTIVDTDGKSLNGVTDANGYFIGRSGVLPEAGKEVSAVAIRGPWISEVYNNEVFDITPPEPAELKGGGITTSTKQLKGENAEPDANIYLDIDGTSYLGGKVDASGNWTYNLPKYLSVGNKVTIYLQDNAGAAPASLSNKPSTNSVIGNINPIAALNYADAVFKPATQYTVTDDIPVPHITQTVTSSGGTQTQIGDTLSYEVTVKNDKNQTIDSVWKDAALTIVLPDELEFDDAKAAIEIDGVSAAGSYVYEAATRTLKIDVGSLQSQESKVVTFKFTVADSALGKEVTNTVEASGYSPKEAGTFIEGPVDSGRLEVLKVTDSIKNPGGLVVDGDVIFSVPTNIDFGAHNVSTKKAVYEPQDMDGGIVVQDKRVMKKEWQLTVALVSPLSNGKDVLADGLVYVKNGVENVISGNVPVMEHTNANNDPYVVNNSWSPTGDGLKISVDSGAIKSGGQYQAKLVWSLTSAP